MHGEQYQQAHGWPSAHKHALPTPCLAQAAALRTLCQALVPDSARYPISQVGGLFGVYHSAVDGRQGMCVAQGMGNASRNAGSFTAPTLIMPGHGGARTAGVAGAGAAYGH